MRIRSLAVVGLAVAATTAVAMATPSFNGSYTQDFNGMGTGTALPDGWAGYSISGSHDSFTPPDSSVVGVLPTGSAIKGGSAAGVTAATPSNQKSSGLYNWAVGGSSSERSLGTSPTGVGGTIMQLTLTNTQSTPISQINISYDIRRFSACGNNNGYSTSPYYGKEELPGYWLFYSLDSGSMYTSISSLSDYLKTPKGA